MPLRALPPQGSASANFATWAGELGFPFGHPWGQAYATYPLPDDCAASMFIASGTLLTYPPVLVPTTTQIPRSPLLMPPTSSSAHPFLAKVEGLARASGVFGTVAVKDGRLVCHAKAAAAPASYRLFLESGKVWASLVMADRWLSESIETDLLHTGDKMEDLLAEELAEQGFPTGHSLHIEHFRSDDLLFTFRSPLPLNPADSAAADAATRYLLAYEACFRNLGDMEESEE